MVFFFSLWVAFSWAILYLNFSSIPLVFSTNHGFNVQQIGAVFSAISIGSLLATLLSIYQEKAAARMGKLSSSPEGRLYFACVESILMPVGLFWFGWTSYPSIPWIVPVLALGCATMGIFTIYLATFNYLADTYHRYASSAIAAQSFCMLPFPLILTYSMLIGCDCRPEYPGRCLSFGGQCYVHESWVSGSREFAGRHCESSMSCPVSNCANELGYPAVLCPVDSGILRSSNSGPE